MRNVQLKFAPKVSKKVKNPFKVNRANSQSSDSSDKSEDQITRNSKLRGMETGVANNVDPEVK